MTSPFRVAVSARFRRSDSRWNFPYFDLSPLTGNAAFEVAQLGNGPAIAASELRDFDGLILAGEALPREALEGQPRLAVVARFGVGYDQVDVPACTEAGVALTITPDAVRRPVAVAAMTLVLALAGRLLIKDRLTRQGAAGFAVRTDHMGVGLEGRTLGSVGLGNIAAEMFRLAAPFGMRHLAHDPWIDPEVVRRTGVTMTDLDTLFREADFLCLHCPLTPQTRHLIDAKRLRTMKPTAFLINTARGGVVEQSALEDALAEGVIAGAGLDVLDPEPPPADARILGFPNVILGPHALAWTDQCFAAIGAGCVSSMQAVSAGKEPANVVNGAVLTAPAFQVKLAKWKGSMA
ncbi:MAG TPA: NAD(P)-dependent oxidoreductase [Vicinamibacterales bacterium]|nr:NAD(P)-dependent oxidoreductase [Vicinamibacterales bacterium]